MKDASAPMELSAQLCFALYSASRAIQREYRPLLSSHGLTYPQYLVMLVLWERDGICVSTIATELGLNAASTTPLLQRMEALGLIERTRGVRDERTVIVGLTQAGRDLQATVQHTTNAVSCAASEATPDADALRALLHDFVDALAPDGTSDFSE